MSRWKASALHLMLSALVIGTIALTVLFLWYPYGTYKIAGIAKLITILFSVDVAIGPLLTLIVYRQGKASLRKDLAIICLLQLIFLSYGLNTLWNSRPVFLVATEKQINLVFANEISNDDLSQATDPAWRHLSITGPILVGAKIPTDPTEQQQLLFSSISTGVDIERLPKYYVSYNEMAPELLKNTKKSPANGAEKIATIVSRYNDDDFMLIDGKTGRPIKVIDP